MARPTVTNVKIVVSGFLTVSAVLCVLAVYKWRRRKIKNKESFEGK